jgi:hypothetical protein
MVKYIKRMAVMKNLAQTVAALQLSLSVRQIQKIA